MRYQLTEAHVRALTAAIGSPEVARDAYLAWSADGHLPDAEERRLLALIAANVSPLLPEDRDLVAIQRKRRETLANHLRRVASCNQVADALLASGIDSLWFKGVGMLSWYPDPSRRTMWDADLLVPWQLRHEAIDVLAARGFKPVFGRGLEEMHVLTASYPGWGMKHADETEIDVHWRPLHHLRQRPHVDADLFSRGRVTTIGSLELVVPDPSHHLVLVMAHGMRAASDAHLISLIDACQLLRADDFDADRAADLAREYERTSALIQGCTMLHELNLTPDLGDRIAELRKRLRRRTVADRLIARAATTTAGPSARRAQLASDAWAALSTPLRKGGPLTGLLETSRSWLGVQRAREIPGQLLWQASGRRAALERLRADSGTPPERRLRLAIGDPVRVGEIDSLSNLLPTGWWEAEGSFVWSQGQASVIDFDVDLGAQDGCVVELVVSPFVGDTSRTLEVAVSVNRRRYARWQYMISTPAKYTHRIPMTKSMLDDRRCQIMLICKNASSPKASGVSDDARTLGLSLVSLALRPAGLSNI